MRLRRFALVGALVTAVDVGVLLLLGAVARLPVLVADAVSVGTAAVLSRRLHRSVTFADEPRARWVREPGVFVRVTILAGVLDLAVLRTVVAVTGPGDRSAGDLLLAKAAALAAAAAIRVVGFRTALHPLVRADQARTVHPEPAPGDVRLSVVVPAYREEGRIGDAVARLRAAHIVAEGELEIVVVDDGSPDRTPEAARAAGADQVIVLPENRGKGAAVRAGMLAARGRAVVFTDADLAYAPEQIARLLAVVEDGADVVVGSRRHVDATTLVRARRLRELTGRVFNLLTFVVLLGQYRDTQCGLKGFRSDAARLVFSHARIDGFAFDVEVLHLAERYRLGLREVPVEVVNDPASTVHVLRDALRMLRDVFRIRRLAAQGVYSTQSEGRASPTSR